MAMIDNDWLECVQGEFRKSYYKELYTFVKKEYDTRVIYPLLMTFLMHFI